MGFPLNYTEGEEILTLKVIFFFFFKLVRELRIPVACLFPHTRLDSLGPMGPSEVKFSPHPFTRGFTIG